jgi:glycosyltransferase involved in cell wall biosynthesis
MTGDVQAYQQWVEENRPDVLFIYAAQQWTFDALWETFPKLECKKVFVPCGFSGLYDPRYQYYFKELPKILRLCDALIFHAEHYRDIDFAKKHGIEKVFIIPNGADTQEFDNPQRLSFRQSYGIADREKVLLTVGALGAKGHLELAQALTLMQTQEPVTIVLNGNHPISDKPRGFRSLIIQVLRKIRSKFYGSYTERLKNYVNAINLGKYGPNKRAILCDLPREELISCYFESDLFVFASNIEYSPLVLYEACAAGLPFLSVPVGNSVEIAEWTGGGVICPADRDERGYTRVQPSVLAREIESLLSQADVLEQLAKKGRSSWKETFNWDSLVLRYEDIFKSPSLKV